MRVFACALAISVAGFAAVPGSAEPPARVASLNLCTDELVMLIARPEQIVSLTHLARDRREFSYWREARRYASNDGGIASVAGMRPDLIVTMGGLGRDRERLARRIGAEVIALPFPLSLDDIERSVSLLGIALGREGRARALITAIRQARGTRPRRLISAMYIGSDGLSLGASGLGAEWMALAGLRQRVLPGDRVSAERLLTNPPSVALRSDYRIGQASRGNDWPGFRVLARTPSTRTVTTDGRRWTCMGPSLLPEVLRLRRKLAE